MAFVAATGLLACGFVVYLLVVDVRKQMMTLASASTDTAQFTVAQLDVELLAYLVELRHPPGTEPNLRSIRNRFDVLYARAEMMKTSRVFVRFTNLPELGEAMAALGAFIDRTVPLIDSNDADLRDALPAMERDAQTMRAVVRTITLRGTHQLTLMSDERRELALQTLLRVLWLTLALLALLLVMVGFLTYLVRQTRRRAASVKTASVRQQAIIGSSLDAVLVIDPQGRIIDYNGAAERLFGWPTEAAIGRDISEFAVAADDCEQCALGMALAQDGLARVLGIRADGTRFAAECSVVQTVSDEGPIVVSFVRDISERLATEQAMVAARDKALAGEKAKAELLAVMSHEMRTPLNGILGTAELLSETRQTNRQKELTTIIQRSGQVLLRHVNDVLDISRLDAGKMTVADAPVDAIALLHEIALDMTAQAEAGANSLEVSAEDPRLGAIMGDARKLRQVITNLVGNAVKFTREGAILLSAEVGDDGVVEIAVSDTGVGISAADQARIFEDFVTLDSSYGRVSEGTGLGLPIAQRLAVAMGGTLEVESTEGDGSTFRLRLPFRPAEVGAIQATTAEPEFQPLQPLSVLVVEDNEINRFVVRSMLETDGHSVTEAVNGADGVAKAGQATYDVILMDISMPEMDGTAATRAIRTAGGPCADAPIIALTAHALPADLERFAAAGMTATLTKPLTRIALRAELAKLGQQEDPGMTAPQTPETPSTDAQITDSAQAHSLIEGLGQETFQALLERYIQETSAGLDDLDQSVRRGEAPMELAARAHKLAGTAAMFGASALRAALIALENDVKSGRTDTIGTHAARAIAVWPATCQSFARLQGTGAA